MNDRRAWLTAVAICLTFLLCGQARAEEAKTKPNIILCMADDQGWGDVGYTGHPVLKTPNLDALAAAGLRFNRFYAAAPVCSPTRGSVMTGRHPNRFGCFKWGYSLRPQEVTIAEALKEAGYTTGHFGKWHLGSVQKGSPVNPGASGFDRWLSAPNFFDNDPILSREGKAVQFKGESSIVTADTAIEFIRAQARTSKPFLAVVWFGSPHGPHQASKEDRAPYADQGEKKANFYGEIAGLDRAVGKLRQELRTLKIHDNTIFWYCSDNGGLPGLAVTGGRMNKGSIYEGGLRVPSIIEWPARISKPRITEVPANTVDIYPTLLEIAGAKPASQPPLDGISLVPLIDGKMKARSRPMGFWDYSIKGISTPSKQWMTELLKAQQAGDEVGNKDRLFVDAGKITRKYPDDSFPGHAAWLDWPWKLHRIEKKPGTVRWELYNLADDPNEQTDRSAREQERVKTLRPQLEKWLKSVVDSLNGKDYTPSKETWKKLFDGKTLTGWKKTDFGGEGKVSVKDGAIILDKGMLMTGITYAKNDFPKMDYEVTLEGKRIEGRDFFCTTTFPVGDSHCSFVVGGWGGTTVGLSSIDDFDASENETSTDQKFKNGQWYRIRIRVAKYRIDAWIDKEQMVEVDTTGKKISVRVECLPSRPFGVSTWETTGAIRDIRVRMLSEAEKKAIGKKASKRE